MDIRLPDGTILKNVPEGTTKAEINKKLQAAGYDMSLLGETPKFGQNIPEAPPLPTPPREGIMGSLERGATKYLGHPTREEFDKDQTTAIGTMAREGVLATPATAVGLTAATRAMAATPAVLPIVGPFAKPIAGVLAGGLGGFGASMATESGLSELEKRSPAVRDVLKTVGLDEEMRQAGRTEHPYAAISGQLMAAAPFVSPFGAGVRERVIGGALEGGIGSGVRLATGEEQDWKKTALEFAGGATMSGQFTRAGQKLAGSVGKPPTVPEDRSLPPTPEAAREQQLTTLNKQKESVVGYIQDKQTELADAKAAAEKNPNLTWKVERAENALNDANETLASVDNKIKLATEGGATPIEQPMVDSVQKAKDDYNLAYRKSNEVAAKIDQAEKAGRTSELANLKSEFNRLIKDTNAAKTHRDTIVKEQKRLEAEQVRTQQESTTTTPENADVVTPLKTTPSDTAPLPESSLKYATETDLVEFTKRVAKELSESPAPERQKELFAELKSLKEELISRQQKATSKSPMTLAEQGRASSVQIDPDTTGQVRTDDINLAFDPAKVETWSDEAIANAVAVREAKYATDSSAQVKNNIQQELNTLYSEQQRREILDSMAKAKADREHYDYSQDSSGSTAPTTVGGLKDAVEAGGWRAGLNHIVANLPDDNIVSVVSRALLKNKWINPKVSYLAMEKLGRYELGTENVGINRDRAPNSATALVHEVVHRASSNAITQFEIDPSKLTSRERRAINQLVKLYDEVKGKTRVQGTKPVENMREFLAYGLTHEGFASYLNTLKGVEKVSAYRKLANAVMDLLGFDPKVRTAYSELLGIGKTLIAESRALNYDQAKVRIAGRVKSMLAESNVLTELPFTQDQVIKLSQETSDISGSWWYKNTIGKTQLANIYNNAVVKYTGAIVRRHEYASTALKQAILYGKDVAATTNVGKRFTSLRRAIADKSVHTTWNKIGDELAADLHDINKRFFEEGVTRKDIDARAEAEGVKPFVNDSEAFDYHLQSRLKELRDSGAHQDVLDAFESSSNAFRDMQIAVNKDRQYQGKGQVPMRYDYYQAVRKGQFHVGVFANDLIIELRSFRTKLEADLHMKAVKETRPEFRVEFEDGKAVSEGAVPLSDQMDIVQNMLRKFDIDPYASGVLDRFDQMMTTGLKFGKHGEYRTNLTGYKGSEWFKTKAERGASYKEAMFDWVDEQTSIKLKQDILYDTERLLTDPSVEAAQPQAVGIARQIRDMGINADNEWGFSKSFDKSVRLVGDHFVHNVAKLFGKTDYVPKIAVVDKTMGVMSSMFYMTTLTPRAGFWVSQILTAPTAVRHLLRDMEMPLMDIVTQFSKGSARTFGAVPHSKISADVMSYLFENTTSLRPQLQNELNTFKWMSPGSHNKLVETLRLVTGSTPSELADVMSRVWTANMMIEHYSAKGLKGIELAEAVASAVDDTMVTYNRSNKAGWVDKAGIIGQAANPLMTFSTAQLGNLFSDIHFAARNAKNPRAYLPAINTLLTTQLMAGAIGLPLLVEYEFLRDYFAQKFPEEAGDLASIKQIMVNQPAVFERGLPSAITGFDVGSGLRWNPFISKFVQSGNQSLIDLFPAIAFAGEVGKTLAMSGGEMLGISKPTLAEKRTQYMRTIPFVGGKAAVDYAMFNAGSREFVPDSKGAAIMEQTPVENLSTLFGSRTVEKAKIQDKEFLRKTQEIRSGQQQKKYLDLLADSIFSGGEYEDYAISKLQELGLTGKEINTAMKSRAKERNVPLPQRWLMGGNTPAAQRKKLREFPLTNPEFLQ